MRVFDFDNTIYRGESVFDFYLFSLRYNPRAAKLIFTVLSYVLKYKTGRMTIEQLKTGCTKYAHDYIASFPDPEKMVVSFWNSHMKKIKKWYKPQQDDIIMTASFNVIMDEICKRLGVSRCVCSVINKDTLEVEYLNFSKNKKDKFMELFGDTEIDEFYTDNISDMPMVEIARSAYLVRGNKIKRIK